MKSEALRKAIQQAIKDTSYTLKGTAPEYDSPKFKKALEQSRKEESVKQFMTKKIEELMYKEIEMIEQFIEEYNISVIPVILFGERFMYKGVILPEEEFQTMYKKWQDEKDI